MTIDDFIKIVSPKLSMPVEKSFEIMKGSELKLTGYKEVKGKPIEDDKTYRIPSPVVIQVDHKWKLTLAWLRGGKPAVRTYLSKYLKAKDLEKVMTVL
jgi:hypothetical protein